MCIRDRAAIEAFAGYGLDHLARAGKARQGLPATLAPAYLPVALVRPVLAKAAADGRRALEGKLRTSQWRRQLSMALMLWRRRF